MPLRSTQWLYLDRKKLFILFLYKNNFIRILILKPLQHKKDKRTNWNSDHTKFDLFFWTLIMYYCKYRTTKYLPYSNVSVQALREFSPVNIQFFLHRLSSNHSHLKICFHIFWFFNGRGKLNKEPHGLQAFAL